MSKPISSMVVYEKLKQIIPDLPDNAIKVTLTLEVKQPALVTIHRFTDVKEGSVEEAEFTLQPKEPE